MGWPSGGGMRFLIWSISFEVLTCIEYQIARQTTPLIKEMMQMHTNTTNALVVVKLAVNNVARKLAKIDNRARPKFNNSDAGDPLAN